MWNNFTFILKLEIYALFPFCNYKQPRCCKVYGTIKIIYIVNVNFIVTKNDVWGCRYGLWWILTAGYCEHNHKFSDVIQDNVFIGHLIDSYSAVNGFWPMEDFAELANGPTLCGEVARSGCLFAWNFWVTRSTVIRVRAWEGLDQIWRCRSIRDSFLAYHLKTPLARNRALHYSFLKVTTFRGAITLAEGEMCLTGIQEVPRMKFDLNKDYHTERYNGVPL